MRQQGVARGIEHFAKGRVLGLSSEPPAEARLGIDHAEIVQRKRRLVPAVHDQLLARVMLPVRMQVGPLGFRQRAKSRHHPLHPVPGVEHPGSHPSVPLLWSKTFSPTCSSAMLILSML